MTCELPSAALTPTQSLPCASQPCESLPCEPLHGLAHFAPADVPLINRLCRPVAPWLGQLGAQSLSVSLSPAQRSSTATRDFGVVIGLALGDEVLELHAPRALLELSGCAGRSAAQSHGYTLRTETDAMLLELAWLSWIEPLERLLGNNLWVVPLASVAADKLAERAPLAVDIQIGDAAPLAAELHMSETAATQVSALLERHAHPAPAALDALRLLLAVEAGDAPLTLDELRSLEPGDVVMLDCPHDQQLLLRLGQTLETRARRAGDNFECLAPLIAVNPDRNDVMTQTSAAPDLDVALDDLPIKVVCQIGSVELSLAQLREMGPGSLLQLTSKAQDGVDLMVNGRRVGRGELVTIGDGLGVRLLGFNAP